MSEQDIKTPAPAPVEAPAQEAVEIKDTEPKQYMRLAIGSLIVTIVAWIVASLQGWVALGISVLAIVIGAFALRSRRHSVRNTAITSIIASAVLFVVLGAFFIVIYLGLKSV